MTMDRKGRRSRFLTRVMQAFMKKGAVYPSRPCFLPYVHVDPKVMALQHKTDMLVQALKAAATPGNNQGMVRMVEINRTIAALQVELLELQARMGLADNTPLDLMITEIARAGEAGYDAETVNQQWIGFMKAIGYESKAERLRFGSAEPGVSKTAAV